MQKAAGTSFTRAALRSHPKLRWRRFVNSWPFFAWLGVTALAAWFYVRSTQFGTLPGSVQTIDQDVAPLQAARVKAIYVKIGDHVTNGQIVAQMDTILVDAQLAQAEATLIAAQGTLAAYEGQMHTLVRTFDDDISRVQVLIEQQKSQRDSDAARLTELKSIQSLRDELFKKKLITEIDADALRPEIAALEKTIGAFPRVISVYEQTLERNKKERDDLRRSLRIAPDEDVMKAIAQKTAAQTDVLKTAVDMRKVEKETYLLRAMTNGIVSDVTIFPGVIAQSGATVIRIVSESPLIIAYLPEVRRGRLKVGDRGYAFRLTRPPVKVRVVAVAPEIDPTPSRLRPVTAAQQTGVSFRAQRIVLEIEGPSDMTAGESVQIRIISKWWAKAGKRLGLL